MTTAGIDSFHELKITSVTSREGLARDNVDAVLATGDGGVWAQNVTSLDNVGSDPPLSLKANADFPGNRVSAVMEDHLGRLWAGVDDGLFVRDHGKFTEVRTAEGLHTGVIQELVEDKNNTVWAKLAGHPSGLARVKDDRLVTTLTLARTDDSVNTLAADPAGGLYVAMVGGALFHVGSGDASVTQTVMRPPRPIHTHMLLPESDGAVWIATDEGLELFRSGTLRTIDTSNGLPCPSIFTLIKDLRNNLWFSTECGLGMIGTQEELQLLDHPQRRPTVCCLDTDDGARGGFSIFAPRVSRSTDGRLWFANDFTLQVIDPVRLPRNTLPPPVYIERIIADGKEYDRNSTPRLPPHTRDVEIDYTALSFRAPQKVRFRYMLVGHDRAWTDAGARRQAFYTDLSPGRYRFVVTAANDDAVWNTKGNALELEVQPAFYQTIWFFCVCFAGLLVIARAAYLARIRQISRQVKARVEARMDAKLEERTRIAHELHDSLLQGFQGLMFRLQAVRMLLPDRPGEAASSLDGALETGDHAICTAREAVQGLRVPGTSAEDLSQSLTRFVEELALHSEANGIPKTNFVTVGEPRPVAAQVREQTQRIAEEALRNAFKHAHASKIEVQLTYGEASYGASRVRQRQRNRARATRSRRSADISACPACSSARNPLGRGWISAVKRVAGRSWSLKFRARWRTDVSCGYSS